MRLSPGERLGAYEVMSLLAAGGMGEVYKAKDTRLNRVVALKVLAEPLASDPVFRERLEREARTISQLDHPHICALYDVGEHDGSSFLVMQHLEGETLADRLGKGALPIDQALRIATEIADALDKAHRAGIVHRDLKPGNIFLTKSGARLLDFGLAKPVAAPAIQAAALPTMAATREGDQPLTAHGTILGTYQYMAPEQVEGGEADARTDIFAFGAILYEMVAGRRAFSGKSHASLVGAILKDEPPPLAMAQPLAPASLDHLVRGCLAKDPDDRWQTAHDLLLQLRWVATAPPPQAATPVAGISRRGRVVWAAAVLAAVAAGFAGARLSAPALPEAAEVRFDVPIDFAPGPGQPRGMAVSPDGRYVVFTALAAGQPTLVLRPLTETTTVVLPGTTGASSPFWSPDSRSIAFFANNRLMRTDIAGGTPQTIAAAVIGSGGTWGADGTIVFSRAGSPLLRVAAVGGEPVPVTTLAPGTGHGQPWLLPDGRHVLFMVFGAPEVAGVYVAPLDGSDTTRLVPGVSGQPAFSPPGDLLFLRGGSLFAQPFDPDRRVLTGDPLRVADSVTGFSVGSGVLAHRAGTSGVSRLTWFDRSGKALGPAGPPDWSPLSVELSPDDRHAAVHRVEGENTDIWLLDVGRDVATRFTVDPAIDIYPLWSADGSRIVFNSTREGRQSIYEKPSSGTGAERVLVAGEFPGPFAPSGLSPDGRYLVYRAFSQQTGPPDLWVLPLTGDAKPSAWLRTPSDEFNAQVSPDSRWAAYGSNETGRFEVYVQSFPTPGGLWRVSTDGGVQPRWRRDMKEIFYIGANGSIMAAPVTISADGRLETGKPAVLFQPGIARGFSNGVRHQYAVTAGGDRFLVNTIPQATAGTTPVTIVVNWRARLQAQGGTR